MDLGDSNFKNEKWPVILVKMTFDLNNSLWLNLEFCFHNRRPFYREEIDENIFENLKLATSPKNLVLGF